MCSYHLFSTKLGEFVIYEDSRFYIHLVAKNDQVRRIYDLWRW